MRGQDDTRSTNERAEELTDRTVSAAAQMRDRDAFPEEADAHYRRVHEQTTAPGVPYDHVRDLYRLGHNARADPKLAQRGWQEVELALQKDWTAAQRETWGEWSEAREFVRRGYENRPH